MCSGWTRPVEFHTCIHIALTQKPTAMLYYKITLFSVSTLQRVCRLIYNTHDAF